MTLRTLAVSLLLAATVVPLSLLAHAEPTQPRDALVGLPGAEVAARGLDVMDDYGPFATARVTDLDAARLAAEGVAVSFLAHDLGRGAFVAADADAAVPGDLRAGATERFLVQFRGPVKAEWRATLESRALAVYEYLPHDAFLARLSPAHARALAALPEVRAVVPYHPAFKLAPELPASGLVAATALAYPEEPLADVLRAIAQAGGKPTAWATASREHVIDFTVDASRLAEVARVEAVSWIEPANDDASLDNAQSSAITQGGAAGAWPVHAKGVDGSSQVVSVCDTGTNTQPLFAGRSRAGFDPLGGYRRMTHEMHDDAAEPALVYNAHLAAPGPLPVPDDHRKIDLYYSPQEGGNRGDADDADGHGTHTSGTIAGDAPPYGERNGNDGVAFAAKLMICDITTGGTFHILNDYANYWNPAYERGARINSNSWGSTHTNAYTEKARQHDAYVWDHRDFLILRSMGNTGASGSIRPEAVAKSAYGSGATGNGASADNLASFSTGGLTTDGRTKPNGVAPGDCLVSSYTGAAQSYACLGGTSMSTPTTAGAAALVRDYFAKGFYPSGAANAAHAANPSAALVRAILQASGREIGGDRGLAGFPNKAQGWGRVTLEDALYFSGDAKKLLVEDEGAGLATGGTYAKTITVAAGQPLRVMVAWSDAPGAAGANPALVNNLDLTVTGPAGTYRGNAFVGNEVSPDQGVADARNVEEAVYVNAPAAGTYTITVTGTSVPNGPQPFALVVTGDVG